MIKKVGYVRTKSNDKYKIRIKVRITVEDNLILRSRQIMFLIVTLLVLAL